MFTKTKDAADTAPAQSQPRRMVKSAPSIISGDMTVSGALTAAGDIQVDGKVDGDITSGSLTVGEKALVTGDILAEEVVVRGKIVGSIRARKVQLCSTCHVEGDIYHQALAVETGAYFEGNCRHSDDPLKESVPSSAARRAASPERRAVNGSSGLRPEIGGGAIGLTTTSPTGPRIPGGIMGRPAPILTRPPGPAAKAEKPDPRPHGAKAK